MPSFSTLATFFMLSVLLALAPGPDNVFVLLHSALHGRRAGLLVVLGLCTGLLGHTAAVVLGLAALLAGSSWAWTVLKGAGAVYLLWLAYGAWRSAVADVDAAHTPSQPLSAWQTYGRGVLMNLSNPKVALFFLAFLPQFADPARGSVALQVLVLGAVFMLAAFVSFAAIAWFAASGAAVVRRSARVRRWLQRSASLVFVGLALRLVSAPR